MDARDRLRRYLEQRRELGESEFVLDGLSVEEVLSLVGARSARPRSRSGGGAVEVTGTGGVAPAGSSGADRGPRPSEPGDPGPEGPAAPRGQEGTPPPASPQPPPTPEVRFDAGASTDWRAALRNAVGPEDGRPPVSPPASSPPASSPPASSTPMPAAARAEAAGSSLPSWLTALDIPVGLDVARVAAGVSSPEIGALPSLDAVSAHVAACQRCALHKTARHPVPGEGDPQADVLCVGEAPGANEDDQGRPFVGEAGQLLTKILGAIQLAREEVFICNVLKHRPPGNRDPLPDEVAACQPYLLRQIELVRPRIIIAWGRYAAQTLLQTTTGIGQLRGRVHRYHGVPLIVTYHPAALLRNEAWKRPTWEDVKLARRILDAARAASDASDGTGTT